MGALSRLNFNTQFDSIMVGAYVYQSNSLEKYLVNSRTWSFCRARRGMARCLGFSLEKAENTNRRRRAGRENFAQTRSLRVDDKI